ncbi:MULTISPECIES: Rieske (2Fe-2S) protein [unclassified Streptomyces]|jgi:Rieske Fe-S protein|uniref:Rieske (2Fe-2S) protein n=1 Tax=unclassified Streptomyces TaxID=2593676 RepID=UPI000F4E5E0D|nr:MULTISPECIES: Rieske (2Fe-2S) protein [unclassified Streptomyces]MDH6448892.1 Rieske Fe-S protein [Streptomyces sp. SAI-119]MDH6500527.1 Rieske Fe-S protein [Streptomyces sp. SAI-149]QUC60973.1 Rieske (2Fe-2S) protein [Streptomyces sp. A2-16]GLP72275.1 iron-sulfur protein [Streptomyces sp. TUS-ST3]
MTHSPTRRTILLATGAAALTVGCGEYGNENSDSGSDTVEASAGTALAKTSEIPVGGGKIFKDEKVVVTQPKKGEFKAFSNICTHQGCPVASVSGGTINCNCHGSKFNITDGSVANPPANKPLPEKQIKVSGDSIELA